VPLPAQPQSSRPAANGDAHEIAEANGALAKLGRDTLVQAMEKTGWVQAKAARILGLTPRQIGYALKKARHRDEAVLRGGRSCTSNAAPAP
jgi:Nif-specific regulatory protein